MNQILIADKIYDTKETRRKRTFYKITYILCILIVISLSICYAFAEKDRNDNEEIGKAILNQVDGEATDTDMLFDMSIPMDENGQYIDDGNETIPLDEVASTTAQAKGNRQKTKVGGVTYTTEAVLSYPKLGIKYPVLSEESDKLLKVSLCKYWGPNPNEIGNYCIVGHNYRNGRMFGKLSKAEVGDTVTLTGSGKTINYQIYNRYVVNPNDTGCTSQLTDGKKEITLITCTNYGKQRLVLKAREV